MPVEGAVTMTPLALLSEGRDQACSAEQFSAERKEVLHSACLALGCEHASQISPRASRQAGLLFSLVYRAV